MEEKEYIDLNGQKITIEQFEQEKKRLQEQHIKLVEVSKNVYKTRLED